MWKPFHASSLVTFGGFRGCCHTLLLSTNLISFSSLTSQLTLTEMLLMACLKCRAHWTPCSSWGLTLNNISLSLPKCDEHTPWLIVLTIDEDIQTSFLFMCKAGLPPGGISLDLWASGNISGETGFPRKTSHQCQKLQWVYAIHRPDLFDIICHWKSCTSYTHLCYLLSN